MGMYLGPGRRPMVQVYQEWNEATPSLVDCDLTGTMWRVHLNNDDDHLL